MNKKTKPPKIAVWLLAKMIERGVRHSAMGDFEENFILLHENKGRVFAVLWCWMQIMRSFPRFMSDTSYWRTLMFRNYIKIAGRNLVKSKGYAFINISGLSVGIACCILIFLYVQHELSYDQFHDRKADLYKVVDAYTFSGRTTQTAGVAAPTGPAMVSTFPEVIDMVRLRKVPGSVSLGGDQNFDIKRFMFADSTFFELFTFPLAAGDAEKVLKEPFSAVLTRSEARKYFSNEDAIGKVIKINAMGGMNDYTVTGIAEDPPANTHIRFDVLVSFSTLYRVMNNPPTNWLIYGYHNYVELQPGTDPDVVTAKMSGFITDKIGEELGPKYSHHLVPVTGMHLGISRRSQLEPAGNIAYIYIFIAVAFFILMIACVNFMNLATARSSERAKEVGMRKVMGAYKSQLVAQFLGESIIMSAVAVVFAILLVEALLPHFNSLVELELAIDYPGNSSIVFGLLFLIPVVGMLAGSYPAMYLSRLLPVKILKGFGADKGSNAFLRKTLVVFQFAVSAVLIIATTIVNDQLTYFQNKNLGFNKNQIIAVQIKSPAVGQQREAIKNELLKNTDVLGVSVSSSLPSKSLGFGPVRLRGQTSLDNSIINLMTIDEDFLQNMDIELVSGRGFSKEMETDVNAYVLNEEAVKQLGIASPGDALTHFIEQGSATSNTAVSASGPIIGVVKNFNFNSLHSQVQPLIMRSGNIRFGYFAIKVREGSIAPALEFIENTWKGFDPVNPFSFTFLDEDFDRQYASEQKLSEVFSNFSFLAIIIACLGLLGLASFTAEQRTREIGIRKVLGASPSGLVSLLSREFVYLAALANMVACPVAYVLMRNWLEGFAYHMTISPAAFIMSGSIAIIIALLTVSYHAVKAAYTNPIASLKYE